MKKLAETVGAPLVRISSKRVELTAAGEEVYATVRRVMQTFRELDETLAAMTQAKPEKLRIATTTAGEFVMPPLLAQFVKLHPGVEVSLHVGARPSVLERLARDEDDLYLLTDPPGGRELDVEPILPNPVVALAPCDHPLAKQNNVSFERFAREPLLVREPGSGTRFATEELFARHGAKPRIAMELGSSESIKEAMLSGLGVAVLHRYSLGHDIEARRLCILDVEGLPYDGHFHVVRASRRLSAVAQAFVEFATTHARRIFAERESTRGNRPVRETSGL
jgi:DNA-binding transcriptional LysR family regulator